MKEYNNTTFSAKIGNETILMHCSTTNTRNGFCHHVRTYTNGKEMHTRVSYYNRTWERFDYESALGRHIDKFPKVMREELKLQTIDRKNAEIDNKMEEFNKRLERIKELREQLNEKQKETLSKVTLTSTDQIPLVEGMMTLMALENK